MTSATTMNLEEFLVQAVDHGPCVGVHASTPSPLILPAGVELRTVNGARITTQDTLFDAFAEAWHFPPRFAHNHSKDAFNDWMRDFDNLTNPALDKPPAPGYLTDVTDAQLFLIEQPETFSWFANKMPFYRDYYRDGADPPAAFGLLLSAPAGRLDEVRDRWLAVDVQVATVTV
jgi:Barstar (barnase inhibitor)